MNKTTYLIQITICAKMTVVEPLLNRDNLRKNQYQHIKVYWSVKHLYKHKVLNPRQNKQQVHH